MPNYLYNGVELPSLPEWDKVTYPYAVIVDWGSGENGSYGTMLFVSTTPLTYYAVSNTSFEGIVKKPYIHYRVYTNLNTDPNAWEVVDWGADVSIYQPNLIWANHDVVISGINTITSPPVTDWAVGDVVLPASDPVPVGGEPETLPLYYSRGGVWQRVYRKTPEGWRPVDIVMGVPDVVETFNQLDGTRFIYFTDPHLSEGVGWEPDFHKYMAKVKQAFDASGCELVICGGDWIGNSDTKEQAIAKLTYIKSYMGKLFGSKALMVLGNHDTNYQGEVQLTRDEVNELWFKDTNTGKAYYYVDTDTARFIVLDTQTDWAAGWSDYFLEQYNWLAANLSEDKLNVVVPHIIWVDSERTTRTALADVVRVMGGVSLVLGGHLHEDYVENGDVPEVLTTDMRAGGTPTFDLCALNNTKLTMLRVGSGENRTIDLGGA